MNYSNLSFKILLSIFFLIPLYNYGQLKPKDELLEVKFKSDNDNSNRPVIKPYLQTDKPYYALGDTLWFKAYLLDLDLTSSRQSGIVYVDIENESNQVVKQYKLPVQTGITWGNISLNEIDFTPGNYTLRAYTNWMRNFGEDSFFYKTFYISPPAENNLLVNSTFTVKQGNADVKLKLKDMDLVPFALKPLQLQVLSGPKFLYKKNLQTDAQGLVDINFNLPEKASGLTLIAETEKKGQRLVVPITVNRSEDTDLQFFPEGGSLVAGLHAHIGFKAIGTDGNGIDISGIVTDLSGKQIVSFKSLHKGMGNFNLQVQSGEAYLAKVTLPGGSTKVYPLPGIKNTGTVLQVINEKNRDSIEVTAGATNDLVKANESYFLIGKARGVICYASIINFDNSNYIKIKIAKALFPSGIAHFTIMTTGYKPLNERQLFISHNDCLNIQVTTNNQNHYPRDSVSLQIKVSDHQGKPAQGNFSLAVTDDTQVKPDSLNQGNIITRMLLTADLKGYVEEPWYYFSTQTVGSWQALDNLLLTQGWVGYNWQQVFNPPTITYQQEGDFAVKGSVANIFNKPLKATHVLLYSKSPTILIDTTTDKEGKFVFDHLPPVDTPLFILKAVNKNGRSFNVGIKVDEVPPPAFTKPLVPLSIPWYVNSDTTLLKVAKAKAAVDQPPSILQGNHVLKEVTITAKKTIKGSQNLNGPGNADEVIDEKELEKAGKKNLFKVLEEKIPGFREKSFRNSIWFAIKYKYAVFVIDGIKLTRDDIHDFNGMRTYLQSQTAEDIKGIEVNFSSKFNVNYQRRFGNNDDINVQYAYIEITTRSGNGPRIDNTPGLYYYKPLAISYPAQFYKPKYSAKDTIQRLPDLRTTVDWEPSFNTDTNGEATISFYTADKASTYTIIMEGIDLNGGLGYRATKVIINKKKE